MSEPLAHSGGHLLADHLQAVANLAATFSAFFESCEPSRRWAYRAGLWHDLGKYRPGFQRYLQLSDNPDSHSEYETTRNTYLAAAKNLKEETGPYKSSRDAYVAATATYTKSLYE